jgi:hypothetical protein
MGPAARQRAFCRIGEAASTLRDGRISHCNPAAQGLGIAPGMACADAVSLLRGDSAWA